MAGALDDLRELTLEEVTQRIDAMAKDIATQVMQARLTVTLNDANRTISARTRLELKAKLEGLEAGLKAFRTQYGDYLADGGLDGAGDEQEASPVHAGRRGRNDQEAGALASEGG